MTEADADPSTGGSSVAAPLRGVVVIEIGHSVAAPFAGQVFADLGATVFKVENPHGGDDARKWGPPFWHGSSAVFQTLNRNKHSLAMDLKDARDRERLKALAAQADVVVQNMRPGLVEKLGIDADALRAVNPRLIYCNLGAFGREGPLRQNTGYDPLIQAFSGIMSVTGENGRPPVRVGPSLVDMGAGLWSVIGVLAALFRRTSSGEGCTVDTSLYETGIGWMNIPLANCLATGRDGARSGSETPMLVPYRAFEASDRFIVIAAGNDNLFARLCGVLGKPEWSNDPRYKVNADRVANRSELNAMIGTVIASKDAEHWSRVLADVGVPCAPIQTTMEVVAHPQTDALGIMQKTPCNRMSLVGLPLRFDGQRPTIRSAAPELGESNALLPGA